MPAKKQITKEMILSSALDMLKDGGMEAVNVKSLAKHLGCSTQPIYLSFENMDSLRSEVSALAVKEFVNEMKDLCGSDEINLYGIAYIQFAQNESKLFQFLFMRRNAFEQLKEALSPIINSSIERLMRKYSVDRNEADRLHDQLWIHSHGIASMIATDFCDWNLEKAEQMFNEYKKSITMKYGDPNVLK